MTKRAARVWVAVMFTGALVAPMSAQKQSHGWPDSPRDAAKAAKPVSAAKPAPATATAKAVVKPVKAAPFKAAVKPAAESAADAATITAAEVATTLQQQADTLKQLAAEIESQRALMREQQMKIESLEQQVAAATVAPATATPLPPVIAVETGSAKLKVSGLVHDWYIAADSIGTKKKSESAAGVYRTLAPRNERDWQSGFTYTLSSTGVWLQMNYLRTSFDGAIAPRNVLMSTIRTTW